MKVQIYKKIPDKYKKFCRGAEKMKKLFKIIL